jgi:hypothetical protein
MKTSPHLPSVLKSESAKQALLLFASAAAIALIFWRLQFSTDAICCGDFDGYYHVKWSRMLWESLRQGGFPPAFSWLPLTTLDPKNFVDHHLLFHGFQIPFLFGDMRLGAKISAIVFASLAVFSCYWLLVRYQIRYPLIWLLALLGCSAPFLYRLNMSKAPPFAIIFLVIGIYLLFRRKYWHLIPLAFIFTLTYDMFVLLILAAIIWTAVIGWTERRFEWRPLVWVGAGAVAGLIINPYFPTNLQLLYAHARMKITTSGFSTEVGKEWYPYSSLEFLGNSLVACVAMVAGYIAFDPSDRKRAHHSLFLLIFATVLMVMTAAWKRFAEYWPPFAVLFAAFALQPWLQGARSSFTHLSPDMLDELQPFLDRPQTGTRPGNTDAKAVLQAMAIGVVAILLATALFFNLRATRNDIASSEPHAYYQNGADWMRANVPAGELIFNTDWDDFPRLIYYDPSHRYMSGLDPTYLYDKNSKLSELYDRITLGKEEDPGPLIRDRFGARYVFTDNFHQDFFNNAHRSGWFEVVYEDTECTILWIRDQKEGSEPEQVEPTEEIQEPAVNTNSP